MSIQQQPPWSSFSPRSDEHCTVGCYVVQNVVGGIWLRVFFAAGPKERTFSVRQATKERAKKLQRHPSADSRQQHTSQTSLAICLPPPGKQGLPRGALAAERCFPSLTHRTSVSRKYTPWARLVDEFGVQVASWFESSSSLTLQKHREFFLSLWTGIP